MKRLFDVLASLLGIVLLLPLGIILALAVKFGSAGPIFYLQSRVGKNGKDFKLYKFRTMFTGSDRKGLITIGENDNRITRTGGFLRKYKLDELPQLLNVLEGTMSLVGPRPEVRKYVDLYQGEQLKVLQVKPGITDYASLSFIDENKILGEADNPDEVYVKEIMPAKLKLNLKYIEDQGIVTDLKIIFQTLLKIIR